jgi:hypothetical protein
MTDSKMTPAGQAKLARLLAEAKELHGKLGDIHAEIDALLGGGTGIAAQLKQFEAAYDALWCARYAKGETGRYVWTFIRDRPAIKRLIKTLGVEELERRAATYLASSEPFYTQNRHTFSLFVSSINSHARAAAADFTLAPTGCEHVPACKSDQEHTKRRRLELAS